MCYWKERGWERKWMNEWISECILTDFLGLFFRNYIPSWKQGKQPLNPWNKLNISTQQKPVPWHSTVQGIQRSTWTVCFRHLLLWRKRKNASIVFFKIFRNTLLQSNPRWKSCWQRRKVSKCKCKNLGLEFILFKHRFYYPEQAPRWFLFVCF